jgi:Ca2+-binding RTX toxin-like protein
MSEFHGTKHDDMFNQSSDTGSDTFDLFKGGNDTVIAGTGDDLFRMGSSLNSGDRLDGGGGHDVVFLHGDYSAGVTFDGQTIQNIEVLRLGAGFDYDLTTADGNVAAGATLTINAAPLSAAYSLIFDGSAETDGHFVFHGGAGNDTITGGTLKDHFNLSAGGNDTVHGGGGNDVFVMGAALNSADQIDGGAGYDTLILDGDYTGGGFIGANTLQNIERIDVVAGHNYNLNLMFGTLADGDTLTIDGSTLGAGQSLLAVAYTAHGHFDITGGAGSDGLGGGQEADILTGGAGADTFGFNSYLESTGANYDTITDMNFSVDQLALEGGTYEPSVFDAALNTGTLDAGANFDTDLAAAVGAGALSENGAVLFTPDAGTLSGHTFLIVDHNGTAGYQADADYVIDVTGYTGTLSIDSFVVI